MKWSFMIYYFLKNLANYGWMERIYMEYLGEILKPGKDSQVWATYTQEFYEGKPAVTTHKLGKVLLLTWEWIVRTDYWRKIFEETICAIEYSCDGFTIWCYFRVPQWYGDCIELYR